MVNQDGQQYESLSTIPQDQLEAEHLRKIFIGGLDHRTTDEKLKAFYEQWGDIIDVVVMKDPKTKRSRGFGFITYTHAYMVDAAQAARPHVIDGKTVDAKRAVPRNQISSPEASATVQKIFVANLKEDVSERDLQTYFSRFGNVTAVTLVTDKETKKKRGFGFVEFDDHDPVDRICLMGNHCIKNKVIDVKKALSKAEMSKFNEKTVNMENRNANSRNSNWSYGNQGGQQNDWSGRGGSNYQMNSGYPPQQNWGNNWQSSGPGMGMGGPMGNSRNQGMGGYGDPSMAPPVSNMAGPPMNQSQNNWYGQPPGGPTGQWNSQPDNFGNYQQNYGGGPMRGGPPGGGPTRNAPYNMGGPSSGASGGNYGGYNTGQNTRRY